MSQSISSKIKMNGHIQCTCQHADNTHHMHQKGEQIIETLIKPEIDFDPEITAIITSCHNTQVEKFQIFNPKVKYFIHCMMGEHHLHLQMFRVADFKTQSSFTSNANKRLTLSAAHLFKKYGVRKFDLCQLNYGQTQLTKEQKDSISKWMLYHANLFGKLA